MLYKPLSTGVDMWDIAEISVHERGRFDCAGRWGPKETLAWLSGRCERRVVVSLGLWEQTRPGFADAHYSIH